MAERTFRRGDLVRFQYGIYPAQGVIKEDRGPIGLGGRHLYLVEFHFDLHSDDFSRIELPAEDLELVQGAAATR